MKKILWISPYAPYDNVTHAGGKTHNYYLKYFHNTNKFDIHLISLASKAEEKKIDLSEYGISHQIAIFDGGLFKNLFRIAFNFNSVFNNKHWLCHTILSYQYCQLKKMVKQYSKKQMPDIVIMQWTGAAFLLSEIKKLFPGACTVIIEEDVTYLGYERKYLLEDNIKKKKRKQQLYIQEKKAELELLNKTDYVVVNNEKDKKLLLKDGIPENKISILIPYFEDYSDRTRQKHSSNIVFYGAMDREENHQCAMWIINQIMPQLENTGIHLEIIGSNPRKELMCCQSEYIHVRGFVQDVGKVLSEALCFVAPLQMGAGIKIKVLEAMSAGVPVLTNDVGIEGIPAQSGKDYFYCNSVNQYVESILELHSSEKKCEVIGGSGRKVVSELRGENDLYLNRLINIFLEEG